MPPPLPLSLPCPLCLQREIKAIEKRSEEASVVIQHLEMHIINAACDDPGTNLGQHLLLPLLQVCAVSAQAGSASALLHLPPALRTSAAAPNQLCAHPAPSQRSV